MSLYRNSGTDIDFPMGTPVKQSNREVPSEQQADQTDVVDGSNHDMTSTFYNFPRTRPFINTQYKQSTSKPIIPYPETNRDGIYSAMKNLQEKVRRLESERTTAEDNLKNLSNETTRYSMCLQKSQETENLANAIVTKQTKEIESQLTSAESRCVMLEKQLDYMRKMLHTSQQEQIETARRRLDLESQQQSIPTSSLPLDVHSQLKRIPELEREHIKLTATQSISENKIRELEQKLHEEDVHRKLILERANELQSRTTPICNYIPNNYSHIDDIPTRLVEKTKMKKTVKKKKKKCSTSEKVNGHPKKSCSKHNDPSSHYRLNLAEIPFVAGKSTAPSHSVGANIQKVISMMKSHNLALCSSMYNGERSGSVSSMSSTTSLDNDMTEILQQLQDEFGLLSFEHKELSNQIEETIDYGVKHDLKRDLDRVVRRLETKSQQISKVRAHQQKLSELRKKTKAKKNTTSPPQRPYSAKGVLTAQTTSFSPHPKRTLTKQTLNNKTPTSPRSTGGAARNVLNDMRKLQTTLRKDDLSWE